MQTVNGFSLIELLVATSVTAIGLIGTISIQAAAKQFSFDASQRVIAINMAQDMISRIRNNATSASSYQGEQYGTLPISQALNCIENNSPLGCSSQQIAEFDKKTWNAMLNGYSHFGRINGLNSPIACIDYAEELGALYVVVSWNSHIDLVPPDNHTAWLKNDKLIALYKRCGNQQANNQRRKVALLSYLS